MFPHTGIPIKTPLSTSLSACSFPPSIRVPRNSEAQSGPTNLQQSETPQEGTKFINKTLVPLKASMHLATSNDRPYQFMMAQEMSHRSHDSNPETTLVAIVFKALTAYEDALAKAKVLHQDISCGNITFIVGRENETETVMNAILNDWDLCKKERNLALEQTPNGHSGTWAFMSGVSLQYPLKPYRLSDDLEAFIHVVTLCCLRFHWHTMTSRCLHQSYTSEQKLCDAELRGINGKNIKLGEYLATFYYACYPGEDDNGVDLGGALKTTYAESGNLGWKLGGARKPLRVLIKSLCELLRTHYKTIDFRKLKEHYYLLGGGGTLPMIGEDSSDDDDDDSDRDTEADSTTTTNPFTKKPNPGKDLDTHSRIMSMFRKARDSYRDIPAKGYDLNDDDKSPDQFLGLPERYFEVPKGPSGSRRLTSALTSASRASASAENLQGTDSPSIQAVKKRKSNIDATCTRPSKVSWTSEQRSVGEPA